jgi:hypothetical protein
VDAWTFIWLLVILKIPIVALYLIVRWAVRQTPETATEQDGGIGPTLRPRHPRSPRPRPSRRGPHGDRACPSPARVRTATLAGHARTSRHLRPR